MKLREAFSKLHETDYFAAEMEKAMTARKKPGPKPQFVERVDASIRPEVAVKLRREAQTRGIKVSALVRQIIDAHFQSTEEAA